ncbi:MAG: VOC family protein [Jatrophihabitans sp.]
MLDHISVQVDDLDAAAGFYDAVLVPLGYQRLMEHDAAIGYGDRFPSFWLGRASDAIPNRPVHLAFVAPDRDAVEAFFAVAVTRGAEVLHEPRIWPEYHPGYFGAFVRDPDGNNVEAVHHTFG